MKKTILFIICILLFQKLIATPIHGSIKNAKTGEEIIGATIVIKENPTEGGTSDINGIFSISSKKSLPITLRVSYIGFQQKEITINKTIRDSLQILLEPADFTLEDVVVTARRRTDNELAMTNNIKLADVVATGISANQISKTSDTDAGEVIKRIPGISLIDNRFIIVRGLAQRYNNVWINNSAVPSSETDGRAFSFDGIASSNIDNIFIVKSPSATLPGDFSGGFVKITTKNMPSANSFQIAVGTGINSETHFTSSKTSSRSKTDWLGFDNGKRELSKGFPSHLKTVNDQQQITQLTREGFDNDWSVHNRCPLPDLKLNITYNKRVNDNVGTIFSLGYSNVYKTITDITSRRYGIYDAVSDRATIEKDYTDNQYSNEVKINAMNNWSFILSPNNRIEFTNLFNLNGKNRLTERYGISLVSGEYFEKQTEMLFTSRLTYSGQLSGSHILDTQESQSLNWNMGYSYANKNEPDRRIISNIGSVPADKIITADLPSYNDRINRYFQKLDEHIVSATLDYKKIFKDLGAKPEIKAGLYTEYRTRDYTPREFIYRYDNLSIAQKDEYLYLPFEQMMSSEWMGSDKVYIDETTWKFNAYAANNMISAAYVATNFSPGRFDINVGVRAEWWRMNLEYDRSMSPFSTLMTNQKYNELSILPSANMAYNINKKQLIRLSYGRTVNRPEFREVSPSVYYDFDLFAEVEGNPALKMAVIDNVDLRYEWYPTQGETVSLGVFYKHFKNPIEWNFFDMGGMYRYSYTNAQQAYTAGVELDIRKSLDFMGIPSLSLIFNGALVKSKVMFDKNGLSQEKDRALQGQSPYIVNTGLFYSGSDKLGLSASILYNTIGKRIIGVGKSITDNGNTDYDIPDTYEMPRHSLDLTVGKKFGKIVDVKLGVKDILTQPVVLKQYPTLTQNNQQKTREQVTRKYYPGSSYSLTIAFNF